MFGQVATCNGQEARRTRANRDTNRLHIALYRAALVGSCAVLGHGTCAVACGRSASPSRLPASSSCRPSSGAGPARTSRRADAAGRERRARSSESQRRRARALRASTRSSRRAQRRLVDGRARGGRRCAASARCSRRELRVARSGARVSQRRLATRIRFLYDHGTTSTLELLFGARSLDDALSEMDNFDRVTSVNDDVLHELRADAVRLLAGLTRSLTSKQLALDAGDAAQAEAVAGQLAQSGARLPRLLHRRAGVPGGQGGTSPELAALEQQAQAENGGEGAGSSKPPVVTPVGGARHRHGRRPAVTARGGGGRTLDRQRDRLLPAGEHRFRAARRVGDHRGRPVRDPARDAPDGSRATARRWLPTPGQRSHRRHDRSVVPVDRPGPRMGPPVGDRLAALATRLAVGVSEHPGGQLSEPARKARGNVHAGILGRRSRSFPRRPPHAPGGAGRRELVGEAQRRARKRCSFLRETAPEVVVMDLNMPGISGIEATRQIDDDRAGFHARARADDLRPGRAT